MHDFQTYDSDSLPCHFVQNFNIVLERGRRLPQNFPSSAVSVRQPFEARANIKPKTFHDRSFTRPTNSSSESIQVEVCSRPSNVIATWKEILRRLWSRLTTPRSNLMFLDGMSVDKEPAGNLYTSTQFRIADPTTTTTTRGCYCSIAGTFHW